MGISKGTCSIIYIQIDIIIMIDVIMGCSSRSVGCVELLFILCGGILHFRIYFMIFYNKYDFFHWEK